MTLKPGTRLGPYEILAPIGAGGMGEVYKGRDTRLDRFVAIKVLPAHLAGNPELRERFEREAHTIANLKHPHICVLYDVGKQDGIDYLVMEYLEGETLTARLLKGPLPLDLVLRYATEMADALDTAHRLKVTHRDLKPGNIMLTKDGSKLLDFGLAKLKQEASPKYVLDSQAPTPPPGLTVRGSIMGTPHYMAPEQAEGKNNEIDDRTDIFSFGAVVYEMATGKRTFECQTPASLISSILRDQPPPMSSLQTPGKMSPPALDRAVQKCLAKDPDERWQTARDLWHELEWVKAGGGQVVAPAPPVEPAAKSGPRPAVWGLISVVVVALSVLLGWYLKPAPAIPTDRLVVSLAPGERLAGLDQQALAISPDGKNIVYVASRSGVQQLYLRSLDGFEARAIPGTEGAVGPFFSPDGQWIGFVAQGSLKKVAISGGTSVTIVSAAGPLVNGATWISDGTLVIASGSGTGPLLRVPAAGGTPQNLTAIDSKKGELAHRWPEFLPGGKAVLFAFGTSVINWRSPQLGLYIPKTGQRQDLLQSGTRPRYSPTGHLLYAQTGTLMAMPFDLGRLEARGSPVPVAEGIMQSVTTGSAQYSISDNGSLVYIPGGVQSAQRTMVWVDRKGTEQPLSAPAHAYRSQRISPDGRRVAVLTEDSGQDIWVYDLGRDTLSRLTFETGSNANPAWSPDGKRIVFQSGLPPNLFWQPADGSGKAERLTTSEILQVPGSWSPDGQALAFYEVNPTTNRDIWILRMSDRKAQVFLKTPFNEAAPTFSPDGRWLAYQSDESGHYEVYVQPYPGPGGKWQISTDGGTEPLWNRNGREIFYRSGNKMMAVEITTQPGFSAGKPRMLFEGAYMPAPGGNANFDVSPDGERFLMVKTSGQEQTPTQINVVLNWFEELKRKVPK